MTNPYMKFQNPSMHGSWTDGHTDAQPENNVPRQFLWSWGHNDRYELNHKKKKKKKKKNGEKKRSILYVKYVGRLVF